MSTGQSATRRLVARAARRPTTSSRSLAAAIEGGFDRFGAPPAADMPDPTSGDRPGSPPPPPAMTDTGPHPPFNFVGAEPAVPAAIAPAARPPAAETSQPAIDTSPLAAGVTDLAGASASPPAQEPVEPSVSSPAPKPTMADRLVVAAAARQQGPGTRATRIPSTPNRQSDRPELDPGDGGDPVALPTVTSPGSTQVATPNATTVQPARMPSRLDGQPSIESPGLSDTEPVSARMTTPRPAMPAVSPGPPRPVAAPGPTQQAPVTIGSIEIITPAPGPGRADPLSPLAQRRRDGRARARRSRS